jgi:hypothetical protein
VLLHSGGLVYQDHLGSGNERSAWIGNQAADGASAGLGKRYGTRAQEKNTKSKKIPYSPEECIRAIHEQPPYPESQSNIQPIRPSIIHKSLQNLYVAANKHSPTKCLLKRMNGAFIDNRLSRKKRRGTRNDLALAKIVSGRVQKPVRECTSRFPHQVYIFGSRSSDKTAWMVSLK